VKKELIINSTVTESRIALLEDGALVNLFVERPEHERPAEQVMQARPRGLRVGEVRRAGDQHQADDRAGGQFP